MRWTQASLAIGRASAVRCVTIATGRADAGPDRTALYFHYRIVYEQQRRYHVGARDKLNKHHIVGSLGLAAVVGGLTGSWIIFGVVATALIATGIYNGDIRGKSNRRQGR